MANYCYYHMKVVGEFLLRELFLPTQQLNVLADVIHIKSP